MINYIREKIYNWLEDKILAYSQRITLLDASFNPNLSHNELLKEKAELFERIALLQRIQFYFIKD